MWALTDFTEANGATRVIPGSHLADHSPEYGAPYDSVPPRCPRAACSSGTGASGTAAARTTTDERRVGIAMNYCAGFIRQQENQQLGLPREMVAEFSPRLRQLCGYGVYHGLIGHINKHDPIELLGEIPSDQMLFDNT